MALLLQVASRHNTIAVSAIRAYSTKPQVRDQTSRSYSRSANGLFFSSFALFGNYGVDSTGKREAERKRATNRRCSWMPTEQIEWTKRSWEYLGAFFFFSVHFVLVGSPSQKTPKKKVGLRFFFGEFLRASSHGPKSRRGLVRIFPFPFPLYLHQLFRSSFCCYWVLKKKKALSGLDSVQNIFPHTPHAHSDILLSYSMEETQPDPSLRSVWG